MQDEAISSDEDAEVDVMPDVGKDRFTCPHCGVYAMQRQGNVKLYTSSQSSYQLNSWTGHQCAACLRLVLWESNGNGVWAMVHPLGALGEKPNRDMPDGVRRIYEEARRVGGLSPRSAAALLRLALQMLIDGLEPGSGNINSKIGFLVQRGLHPHTQQAMDVLRVVGNNAVHPGQIDVDDDPNLLPGLFRLTNVVVDQMISMPKHAASLFTALPQQTREQISRRDSRPASS
jgi:hypothetical protein